MRRPNKLSREEGPGWNGRPFGLDVVVGRTATLAMQEEKMVLDRMAIIGTHGGRQWSMEAVALSFTKRCRCVVKIGH